MLNFRHHLKDAALALRARLEHHAAKTVGPTDRARRAAEREQKRKVRLLRPEESGLDRFGINHFLVGRGVRRTGQNSKNNSLVLGRGQLSGRKHEHDRSERSHHEPNQVDGWTVAQRAIKDPAVSMTHRVESAVDEPWEAFFGVIATAQKFRRHHRRERECHDAGNRHGSGQRERKLAEERTRETTLKTDGRVNGCEGERHGDHRSDEFARTEQRGVERFEPLPQVAFDIFDDDNRIVHDETDRKNDGQKSQQINRETKNLHEKQTTNERNRNRENGYNDRAHRTEEKKNHDHHDQQRINERRGNFVNGVADVFGRIVTDAGLEAVRKIFFDRLQFGAGSLDDVDGIRLRQWEDAHEHRRLTRIAHLRVVVFGPEHHIGDVFEPNRGVAALPDDEALELGGRVQIGVGREIHLHIGPLGRPDCRQIIIGSQGGANLRRTDIERRHALGLQPDPHGKRACAEDFRPLHAGHGRQTRLHNADQVIGDLALRENVRGETQVGRRKL